MSNQEKKDENRSEKEVKTRSLFEPMPDLKSASLEDLENWAETSFKSALLIQKFKEFFSRFKKSN